MKSPILGGLSNLRSTNAAANRLVNLYPEIIPEGGKELSWFTRCPGLELLGTVGDGPIRGEHTYGGVLYVVSGEGLYSVNTEWDSTLIGTVGGSGPVSMADNGTQMFIASNPGGYIYNNSTGAFGVISDPDFPGAVTVKYLDGYFVFNEPKSQKVWVTSLLDGTSIDPLEFASAFANPDDLSAIAVQHREAWLFGTDSIEVWYNSGELDFPLTRIQGAFLEIGCKAPYSIAKLDNTLFWLGSDNRGSNTVYRADGWSGVRVSTHSLEYEIGKIEDTTDAVAYSYQQEGHSFYVLNFPSGNKTFVYDVATGVWHERASWASNSFIRHRVTSHASFNNVPVVGDFENGNIYKYSLDYFSDNTAPQKWLRSWRAFAPTATPLERTVNYSLQIDCETGVGLSGTQQGTDPQAMLRWSDDGGHTWSNEHWRSMGKIGVRGRMLWWRLGITNKSRDRVYEVSGTDPVKVSIIGAQLKPMVANS